MLEKEDLEREEKERREEEILREWQAMLEEISDYVKCHWCPIVTHCPHEQYSASSNTHSISLRGRPWYNTFEFENESLREKLDLMKKATENCSLLSKEMK